VANFGERWPTLLESVLAVLRCFHLSFRLTHIRPGPFTSDRRPPVHLVMNADGRLRTAVHSPRKRVTLPATKRNFRLGLTPRRPEMPTNEAPGRLTGYSCMLCFIDDLSDHDGRNGLDMTP